VRGQSYECVSRIYADPEGVPTSTINRQCGDTGASKAFLITSRSLGSPPAIEEIKPRGGVDLQCQAETPCSLAVEGVGLREGDAVELVLLREGDERTAEEACPSLGSRRSVEVVPGVSRVSRVLGNSSQDTAAVVDVGTPPAGRYAVCYASSLAVGEGGSPGPRDFQYAVGLLDVGSGFWGCDFESGKCGMETTSSGETGDIEVLFKRTQGPASEDRETGPRVDNTLGTEEGHYLVLNSSDFLPGASAIVYSPPLALPQGSQCLNFAYHMYGRDVNALRVYTPRWMAAPSAEKIGAPSWIKVGNQGNRWRTGRLTVESDGQSPVLIVFEGVKGTGEQSIVALDDISLAPGACTEDGSAGGRSRGAPSELLCGEVRLRTGSHARDKSWFVEGAVSCSGRGYSADNLANEWRPCCLPRLGDYTLTLQDAYGDGWTGSVLEFRFLGQTFSFGEDFSSSGAEASYTLSVGVMSITEAKGSSNAIELTVQTKEAGSPVWCAAQPAGGPALSPRAVRTTGRQSSTAVQEAGGSVTVRLGGLQENQDYDVFCYTEAGGMTADEVAATRMTVTTDNEAPTVTIQGVDSKLREATARVSVNEAGRVWCVANSGGYVPTDPVFRADGESWEVERDGVGEAEEISFKNLQPDTEYFLFCTAEDDALPTPNRVPQSRLITMMTTFRTEAQLPQLSFIGHRFTAQALLIEVQLDVPGAVTCLEYPVTQNARPSESTINYAGTEVVVPKPETSVEVELKDVSPGGEYLVYCRAASSGGTEKQPIASMWENAYLVEPFREFCEIPGFPKTVEDATERTVFDVMTPDEENVVRAFMGRQIDLGLLGVYRITLMPDKKAITDFLDKGGEKPKRYARVRAGSCRNGEGLYRQFRVGPLEGATAFGSSTTEMTYEELGEPVPVSCEGWVMDGPFGRRRRLSQLKDLDSLIQESFGYPMLGPHNADKGIAKNGGLIPGPLLHHKKSDDLWLGFKTPTGVVVPLWFLLDAPEIHIEEGEDGQPTKNSAKAVWAEFKKRLEFDTHTVRGVEYNRQFFNSVDELMEEYAKCQDGTGECTLKTVTPDECHERHEERRSLSQQGRRRLQPHGGPNSRGDLDYRWIPEHYNPAGPRYTLVSSGFGFNYNVTYVGWSFVTNWDRDKSLQLWDVRFNGQRMAYEIGLQEALAHYTVHESDWWFLDSWFGGLGSAMRKLFKGIECPQHATMIGPIDNLCIFEWDRAKPLRSHYLNNALTVGTPGTALVLRCIITVSNYDYILDYIFHPNGAFQSELSFTGELYMGIEVPQVYSAEQDGYGFRVNAQNRMGTLHSHQGLWKVDLDVGGDAENDSVYWDEVQPDDSTLGGMMLNREYKETEKAASLPADKHSHYLYHVADETKSTFRNDFSYWILPYEDLKVLQPDYALYDGPASWTKYKFASTVYKESELDCQLPRDNKFTTQPAMELDRMVDNDENIRGADVVTWISSGVWHTPSSEDMPVTYALGNTLGFLVKPFNIWDTDTSDELHNGIGGNAKDPGSCAIVRDKSVNWDRD